MIGTVNRSSPPLLWPYMRPDPLRGTITECGMCSTCRSIMPTLIVPENDALMESVYSVPFPARSRENNTGTGLDWSGCIAAYLSTPSLPRVYIKPFPECTLNPSPYIKPFPECTFNFVTTVPSTVVPYLPGTMYVRGLKNMFKAWWRYTATTTTTTTAASLHRKSD